METPGPETQPTHDNGDGNGWRKVTSRRKKGSPTNAATPPPARAPAAPPARAPAAPPAPWAVELERSLNIWGLAATLCGPVVTGLNAEGWEFAGVIRGGAAGDPPGGPPAVDGLSGEFRSVPIAGNRWRDVVLLRRTAGAPAAAVPRV